MALTQRHQVGTAWHTLAGQAHAAYCRSWDAYQRAQATYARTQAIWSDCQATIAAAPRQRPAGPAAQGHLPESPAYARLLARLATMPAIEQAKGIVMAQSGCSADQAFDRLRRASQRLNIPVRDLASRIIASAATPGRPELVRARDS